MKAAFHRVRSVLLRLGAALGLVGQKKLDASDGDAATVAETRNPTNEFPASCYRGLKSPKWIKDGKPTSEAFAWDRNQVEKRRRQGKRPGPDISINWNDDEHAVGVTRADAANAKAGVAEVPLFALEYAATLPLAQGATSWERDPLPDNQYHGNLVIDEGVPKQIQHLASSILATCSEIVPLESAAGAVEAEGPETGTPPKA